MPIVPGSIEWKQMLEFARKIAREGGEIAMKHYGNSDPQLKYDMSLVTQADLEVQGHLKKRILERYPDHKFFGEEQDSHNFSGMNNLWVVDPVDGTAAFSSQLPIWGISISHYDDGDLQFGVFYMPATDEMFSGMGKKAYRDGVRIRARIDDRVDNEAVLLTYSRFHQDFNTNFPGKVRSLGSSVAHIAYVASGAAWGALLGRVHIWDIAPGLAILRAAGGEIRDLEGNLFDSAAYLDGKQVDKIYLAAAKGQHDQLASFLTRK